MHKTAFKLNARSKPLIPGLLLALVMTLPASCIEFTEGKPDFLYQSTVDLRNYWDSKGYKYEYVETDGGHIWRNWRIYLTMFAQKIFK